MNELPSWKPTQKEVEQTHIYKAMQELGFETYQSLWNWSVGYPESFWEYVLLKLKIPFYQKPERVLDLSQGVTHPLWLKGAKMNIVEACFNNPPEAVAIKYQPEEEPIQEWTFAKLEKLVNQIANGLIEQGLQKGDCIAIDLPMTVEAVAIYLAGIKAGMVVATIADSFTPQEIAVRLEISKPKLVFTQDFLLRAGKKLPLYAKVKEAFKSKIVVIQAALDSLEIAENDILWSNFLNDRDIFQSVPCHPDDTMTILFSSGTTSAPKAIPWTHTTPIKSAMDGYFHQDIHKEEVVAWPTNLGWMMGPWLVFASLINGASMALYGGAPAGEAFGKFVEKARVNMLGLVPSMVKNWKATGSMLNMDWTAIKCFSSTGEASNPEDYAYLMALGGHKPIIEYCGGTEIGGGYITSTLVQENIPATFSSKALGSDFVLLDENFNAQKEGEVFLIPPTMGLSNKLLNKDHHAVYYEGIPQYNGKTLRRHGDQMEQLKNGYFKAQGRADDAMNLGGIKVSSVQIEEVVNSLGFVKESAAISVPPSGGGPEVLVIYYVLTGIPPENDLSSIAHVVKTQINPLFKVVDVVQADQLPRTASGKVMRRELRKKYFSRN
jgi:acetyl-CoA synthetase